MRWLTVSVGAVIMLGANRLQAQVPVFNRDMIVLDAAHGGQDTGARITDSVLEKDLTLQVAERLRSLLVARGFSVVSTRENADSPGLTTDQRAEIANKAHAVACIVIHATASGNGVHLGTSALGSPLAGVVAAPAAGARQSIGAVPWDRAQEIYLPQSLRLADQAGVAFTRSNLPLASGRLALRPLDNLMCPAISIEMAPQRRSGSEPVPVSNEAYQQRVAEALAGALIFWKNQAQQPEYVPVQRPAASAFFPPKNEGAAPEYGAAL